MTILEKRKTAQYAYWVQKLTEDEFTDFSETPNDMAQFAKPKKTFQLHSKELNELASVVSNRKSSRTFIGRSTSIDECKDILALSYGVLNGNHRTVPSAGGFYSLTLWLCKIDNGVIKTISRYNPLSNKLELHGEPDSEVQEGFRVYQVDYNSSGWLILWTCQLFSVAVKYGARAYRFVSIEIGHSAQMASLACCCLGVDHITLGGLIEKHIREKWLATGRKHLPQYALLFT